MDTSKVTRLEIISDEWREFVRRWLDLELSLQDDDRTLKIFINDKLDKKTTIRCHTCMKEIEWKWDNIIPKWFLPTCDKCKWIL